MSSPRTSLSDEFAFPLPSIPRGLRSDLHSFTCPQFCPEFQLIELERVYRIWPTVPVCIALNRCKVSLVNIKDICGLNFWNVQSSSNLAPTKLDTIFEQLGFRRWFKVRQEADAREVSSDDVDFFEVCVEPQGVQLRISKKRCDNRSFQLCHVHGAHGINAVLRLTMPSITAPRIVIVWPATSTVA